MAVLRFAVGLLLLYDTALRWSHGLIHYSDRGVLPRTTLLKAAWHPAWFSLATTVSRTWELHGFFLLLCAVALALALGWQTRWSTGLAWLGAVSVQNRNPLVCDLGDDILRLVLFWMLFLPWGAVWSLDARQGRSDRSVFTDRGGLDGYRLRSLAGLALPLTMLLMAGFVVRAAGAQAYSYGLMPWGTVFDAASFRSGSFLNSGVVGLEIVGCLLLFFPFDRGQTRGAAALTLVALHTAAACFAGSGLFFPLGACLPLSLLSAWWWEGPLSGLGRRLDAISKATKAGLWGGGQRTRVGSALFGTRLRLALTACLLLGVYAWAFARLAGQVADNGVPKPLRALAHCLHLEPANGRFPLLAEPHRGALRMVATKRDKRSFEAGADREPGLDFQDHRQRNYLTSLFSNQDPWLLWGFGSYLCSSWTPGPLSLHAVTKVKVILEARPDSGPDTVQKVLLEHSRGSAKDQ